MAKITVNYLLGEKYRTKVLAETGERLPEKQAMEIELTEVSQEQRQILVSLAGLADAVNVSDHNLPGIFSNTNIVHFDSPLTVEAAAAAAQAKLDTWAALKEKAAEEKAEYSRKMAERIEREREEKQRQDADRERREADREAAKAQAEAEKLAWVNAHGSDHLRTAVNAGYDCTRLYATERATSEHPGYILDYKNNAEWKGRSCPSPKALAEALAVGGEVVWLTEPPRTENPDPKDRWDDSETHPCEAVVIRGFLGKYDLVKTI